MADLDSSIASTLRDFRKRRVEAEWERFDRLDAPRYERLWDGLHAMGVTTLGLPETRSGIALDGASRFAIAFGLGAALPALGFGLIAHATALALVDEASEGSWSSALEALSQGPRLGLVGSPLDARPEGPFHLTSNGHTSVSGSARVALAYPDWLVVPASEGARTWLCVLSAQAPGIRFVEQPSSHGLRLVRFGELVLDDVEVPPAQRLPWPDSGFAAHEADGLLTALLTGMTRELADRAVAYALERRQGGKMIHQHDAVQQLVGPIALACRPLRALALEALSRKRRGDGGASAFAVQAVRSAGLDAIQTLGGNGYMEDFRVERYLRDANTLETFWIHAAARQRAIARDAFSERVNEAGSANEEVAS
ncbi:MAG TPA: acyl-CoA dehydrogenase family protein [Polyangiaceae bacterium]|jgi:alkylation response protein AidB-like acyl-CoA dehydrogenase|nr:acyl-CoA dehydrogenase family protein [Polyangiaceae bacterium]